jgi:hypothetical protein
MQIFFLALFEEKLNKLLDQLNIIRQDIRHPALLDIWQCNPISGRIPDMKKGRIIRSDIWCIPKKIDFFLNVKGLL